MRFSRYTIPLLILLTAYTAAPAQTGNIHGKVIVTQKPEETGRSGLSALYRNPAKHETHAAESTRMNAVIFLKEHENQPAPTPVEGAALVQKSVMFEPHILPVTVGTEVAFPNMDDVYHNVFSFSNVKQFDLGRYAQGKSKSQVFDKPGIVSVFCEIHSNMQAYIVVVPNNYYAMPMKDGTFTIENVPPGTYTLVAWHESFETQEITVTVPEAGDTEIEIRF